uniref:Uncharacterized protein n=1 Tax=Arundo donax TaxID=35708 RepID=A0A0A9BLB7_ARUDO
MYPSRRKTSFFSSASFCSSFSS